MDESLDFDFMYGDILCTTIHVRGTDVSFENFTDDIVLRAFGIRDEATLEDVEELFEFRCFPRTRSNCKATLKSGGFMEYNPYLIVRKTHGIMTDDLWWIHFHDEPMYKYKDLRKKWIDGV